MDVEHQDDHAAPSAARAVVAYLSAVVTAGLLIYLLGFLRGEPTSMWPALIFTVVWGVVSLTMFTRRDH